MSNFWLQLRRPFFVLAPMEDVTDAAFRKLVAERSKKPDVFYTEFTSADGLALAPEDGRKKIMQKLKFGENEHPIVAQFFTSSPEYMKKAASLAVRLGFDGVDINMGCPDRQIEMGGCGAALIKNPACARELIRAAKRGAYLGLTNSHIPVSVKTRVGYLKDELDTWLPELLAEKPAAIAIHARTQKEMSDVPAQWSAITRAVVLRDKLSPQTLIIGNGDVKTLEEGRARAKETGCDGIMIGRAAIANPWLWEEREPSIEERLQTLVHHAKLAQEHYGRFSGNVKKHLTKIPIGFSGAKELRVEIAGAQSLNDIVALVNRFKGGGV